MIRYRFYFDKDAETEWLNQMAADGWAMKRFFAGFYDFEKCECGEYTYQVDFGDRLFSVSGDYRELMQDAGIEIVQTWGFWVILRKKASRGKFELYTDVSSSIGHYKKIRRMFKIATIVEMICFFSELVVGAFGGVAMGYVFALLLGIFLVGLLNATVKLNDVIAELEVRLTGIETGRRSRRIPVFMAAGVLINGCAIVLADAVSRDFRHTIQILAFVCIAIGLFQMCSARE